MQNLLTFGRKQIPKKNCSPIRDEIENANNEIPKNMKFISAANKF